MADPSTYRPAPGSIPTDPGVYKFRDDAHRVIYVGKAKNLRARLSTYFQDLTQLHPRTRQMVTTASHVEWTIVSSEVEALQLEYTWIKKYDPQFNVKYRDDKSYPSLAVSVGETIPRAFFYRGEHRRGVRYFGPYSHAWAVRETLDLITRVFPMRTCSQGVYHRHEVLGRPCLLGYINKCSAPCIGRVTVEEHREIVDGLCSFLAGKTADVVKDLEQRMFAAAETHDFETAARLRDDLEAVRKITEQQAIVLSDGTDADVIACEADELELSIQLFHVRGGRVRGQRGWVVERDDDQQSVAELINTFLIRFYNDAVEQENYTLDSEEKQIQRRGVDNYSHDKLIDVVPREILVEVVVQDAASTQQILSELRQGAVSLRVPRRGDKKALMDTVHRNAVEALKQHKLKRVGDLSARSAALREIQETLMMAEAPLRIECVDISHIQGTDVVASLVVFEDGLPRKSDYRKYKITDAAGGGRSDDVASIAEVTRRRFSRYSSQALVAPPTEDPEEEPTKSHYPPRLFIVDGGQPQVNAAQAVMDELKITDVVVVGIAKRLEEVWFAHDPYPVIFPRNSQALFLIQRIRDEAHRFAISFHRQQRSRRMTTSQLESIKGVGAQRRQELLKHFGSLKQLKNASAEEIAEVKGFGPALAHTVYEALHHAQ